MPEDLDNKDLEELAIYRQYLKDLNKPKTLSEQIAGYLGLFVGYSFVVFVLYLCWNFCLSVVFPVVPNVTFLQIAGLWYLTSVFLKRE